MKGIFFIAILYMAAQPARAPMVSVEPTHLNVLQWDVFTVNITVYSHGVETMGAQYDLLFNNTLLNVTDQTLFTSKKDVYKYPNKKDVI